MNGKLSLLYMQKKHNAYNMVDAQNYLLKEEMDTANLLLTVRQGHTTPTPRGHEGMKYSFGYPVYTEHIIRA